MQCIGLIQDEVMGELDILPVSAVLLVVHDSLQLATSLASHLAGDSQRPRVNPQSAVSGNLGSQEGSH